jgi:hypothetical protein
VTETWTKLIPAAELYGDRGPAQVDEAFVRRLGAGNMRMRDIAAFADAARASMV